MTQLYEQKQLGIIKTHDTTYEHIENTVKMSEKNFWALISLLPRMSTLERMQVEIQALKDKLTSLSFDKLSMSRKTLIFILNNVIEYNTFMDDVETLVNSMPTEPGVKNVGKINLDV